MTADRMSVQVQKAEQMSKEGVQLALADDNGSFAHHPGWKRILEEALGHPYWVLNARDTVGRLVGTLPLSRVSSTLFGDYLVSMPFISYGGPVGSPDAVAALLKSATTSAREAEVDLLEFRVRTAIESALEVNARKVMVLLPLPDAPEELWEDGFRSKLRSQIRRPMKEDMEFRTGPGELEGFYEVFVQNMRDLGTPVLPLRFFTLLREEFGDAVIFSTVRSGSKAVAGGCGFRWSSEFELSWASSLREFNREAPNMLLYWGLMRHCIEEGLSTFNFGRSTPGSGTHRFKAQWGGDDHPLPWLQLSPGGTSSTPNPEESRYQLAIKAWQRLPVGLTRVIGPLISRNLP